MVVRKGFRALLIPLALYCVAFAAAGFFVTQAEQGRRGLEAKRELREQQNLILAEYDKLNAERTEWERRVALFRADALERDLNGRSLDRTYASEQTLSRPPTDEAQQRVARLLACRRRIKRARHGRGDEFRTLSGRLGRCGQRSTRHRRLRSGGNCSCRAGAGVASCQRR